MPRVPIAVTEGLGQSLRIAAQRRALEAAGRAVGTPVVFLKAAWADPVLHGGRGLRVGSDLDVLVHPSAFHAFAERLVLDGYRTRAAPGYPVTHGFDREWTLRPPREKDLDVDLHRGLTMAAWFRVDAASMVARSIPWDSPDGPVRSLDPEDQVLFCAAHYASHVYVLGPAHLTDVEAMLACRRVDWETVRRRAGESALSLATELLLDVLRARGHAIPEARLPWSSRAWQTLRRRTVATWLDAGTAFTRREPFEPRREQLLHLPWLSDDPLALARFAARYALLRSADRLVLGIVPRTR